MKLVARDTSKVSWNLFGDFAGEILDYKSLLRPATREWFTVHSDSHPEGITWDLSKPEVTPAMIDAGIDVHCRFDRDHDSSAEIVAAVYEAMASVAPKKLQP